MEVFTFLGDFTKLGLLFNSLSGHFEGENGNKKYDFYDFEQRIWNARWGIFLKRFFARKFSVTGLGYFLKF